MADRVRRFYQYAAISFRHRLAEELAEKHRVYDCLIPETMFTIVEVLGPVAPSVGPWAAPEPRGMSPTV